MMVNIHEIKSGDKIIISQILNEIKNIFIFLQNCGKYSNEFS